MFDLFGTNQGKDPFKLGKQVSGRRTPRDQKKQNKNTMAVQTAGIFLPTSMNHFPLCVSIKKIQACKFFSLYWRNTSCLVSEPQHACQWQDKPNLWLSWDLCHLCPFSKCVCLCEKSFVLDAPVLLAAAVTVAHSCLKRKVGQQRNWFNKGKR